jgi:hypothetical protein
MLTTANGRENLVVMFPLVPRCSESVFRDDHPREWFPGLTLSTSPPSMKHTSFAHSKEEAVAENQFVTRKACTTVLSASEHATELCPVS